MKNCPNCGWDVSLKRVVVGDKFKGNNDVLMEVVYQHETVSGSWWCETVMENTGLWSYTAEYIAKRLCP